MAYRGIYKKDSSDAYKLSRSGIDLFLNCPRCFYLDKKLGIGQPGGLPFTLNVAVDALLKKEFDVHRAKGQAHPLMKAYKINAVPFAHKDIDEWRSNFKGISYIYEPTNFWVFGAIDDVWQNDKGELHIVDYKATSTSKEVTLDDEWKIGYKRQMEVYQWLFRKNGFKVSNMGYFVFANGIKDRAAFDAKLEFNVTVLPYDGKGDWIEDTLGKIKKCLDSEIIPEASADCEYCNYIKEVELIEK